MEQLKAWQCLKIVDNVEILRIISLFAIQFFPNSKLCRVIQTVEYFDQFTDPGGFMLFKAPTSEKMFIKYIFHSRQINETIFGISDFKTCMDEIVSCQWIQWNIQVNSGSY